MDELADRARRPSVRFGPDRRLTAGFAAVGVVLAILAGTTNDRSGRLILGLAALVVLGYAVTDLLFWPRLAADAAGLQIRSPLARARLAWSDVSAIRADVSTRHGLRSVTLEIDAGATLIVLSRRALGADPQAVEQMVSAFDPRHR